MTNHSYVFDSFSKTQKDSEIHRLTKNVDSHSQALSHYFLTHGLMNSKSVLDVGCGSGAMLRMFADMLPETQFVGVDNSRDILNHAEGEARKNIRFHQSEASSLPFANDSFDFVYTRLVLMHNQNPEDIIREMRRVCKPNGVIMSVEIDDETMVFHPFAEEFSQLIRAHISYAKMRGTDRTMGRKLYSIYKAVGIDRVKVITQTSDYEGPYDDVPFSLRLATGSDDARHLVEAGLITEEQRVDWMNKVHLFCEDPNRFYSGSFMYCVGLK